MVIQSLLHGMRLKVLLSGQHVPPWYGSGGTGWVADELGVIERLAGVTFEVTRNTSEAYDLTITDVYDADDFLLGNVSSSLVSCP